MSGLFCGRFERVLGFFRRLLGFLRLGLGNLCLGIFRGLGGLGKSVGQFVLLLARLLELRGGFLGDLLLFLGQCLLQRFLGFFIELVVLLGCLLGELLQLLLILGNLLGLLGKGFCLLGLGFQSLGQRLRLLGQFLAKLLFDLILLLLPLFRRFGCGVRLLLLFLRLTGEFLLLLGEFLQFGKVLDFFILLLHLLFHGLELFDSFIGGGACLIDLLLALRRFILKRCLLEVVAALLDLLRRLRGFVGQLGMNAFLHFLRQLFGFILRLREFLRGFGELLFTVGCRLGIFHLFAARVHLLSGLADVLNRFVDLLHRAVVLLAQFLAGHRLRIVIDDQMQPFRKADPRTRHIGRTGVLGLDANAEILLAAEPRNQVADRQRTFAAVARWL